MSFKVALLENLQLKEWKTVEYSNVCDDFKKWLKSPVESYDHMVISPTHILYVPNFPTSENKNLAILTKQNEEDGESIDLEQEDIDRLPEILANDTKVRVDFFEAFEAESGTKVIRIE